MTFRELQAAFELKATSHYGATTSKPLSKEIEFWLNAGKDKLIKNKWSGMNSRLIAYEQDQKRIEDLRNLKVQKICTVKESVVDPLTDTYIYVFELPLDYLIGTGEAALLLPVSTEAKKCWKLNEDGTFKSIRSTLMQCTDHNIDEKLINKLSDHQYNSVGIRPLRLHNANEIFVYTDQHYKVDKYILTYLKKPNRIDIHTSPQDEYMEFPNHLQDEIVNMAVQLYLENKENPRYQSHSNELTTEE